MSAFNGWENFYVIVGSSAGALIGLQFVVVTLIAGRPLGRAEAQAGGAFATPNIVHFGVVLFLSAMVSAPWYAITIVAALWGIVGLVGVVSTQLWHQIFIDSSLADVPSLASARRPSLAAS